ncbi:MAG TPA: hypothetical protein VK540_29700, partial [Polyangiaceae bacterium]|nr:hypothetical protein [Polyangiaceae bacterium]
MSGAPTIKVGSGAPSTSTVWEGALYLREDAPNGALYLGVNGVWTKLLTTTAGGSVTLAGDVTGPSNTNTVVSLSGSGGIVTMKADQLSWEANSGTFTISQLPQTTNQAPNDFALVLGSPWASATLANRDAPDGGFWIPPPTAGGATGRWVFYVSDIESFAVEATRLFSSVGSLQFEASLTPVINQATIAGVPHTLTLQAQSSSTTKGATLSLVSGLGAAGSHGDMTFMTGIRPVMTFFDASNPIIHLYSPTVRFNESAPAPIIYIAPRTLDAPAQRLRIRSQDAFASAVTNVTSGDIWYEIGPSIGDPPDPGQHVFWIAGLDKVEISKNALTLVNVSLSFRAPASSNFTIKPLEF